MAEDRAAKIARIQKIERIKALEEGQAPEMNAMPGPEAAGVTSGPTPAAERKVSDRINAAITGFGDSVTMGYLPQLQAAASYPVDAAFDLYEKAKGLPPNKPESYVERRDRMIAMNKELQDQNPIEYGGGQVAGLVSGAAVMPGGAAMKGASVGQKMLQSAKIGALLSGLQNPGDVKGEVSPLQLEKRGINAGVGGVTGGLATGALEGTGRVLAPALRKLANKSGFKALGPYAKQARQAVSKEQVEEIGQEAIDNGTIGWLPRSFEKMEERAGNAAKQGGEELQTFISGASPKAKRISKGTIAKEAAEEITSPHVDIPGVLESNEARTSALDTFKGGADDLSLADAWEKRKAVGDQVNWLREKGADIPETEVVNRKLYGKLKDKMREAADSVDAGKLEKLDSKVHNSKLAKSILERRNAHELAKMSLMTGGGSLVGLSHALATGKDPVDVMKEMIAGGAFGAGSKMAMQYSPQIAAKYGSAVAKVLSKSRAPNNPWLVPNLVKGAYKHGEE